MSQTPVATGTSTPIEFHSFASVVGINFGNSYASIADGTAECIANEDGERQIASAISFHGEETYIGSSAKAQLVKNSQNTIINFRNLLGLKFSEIPAPTSPLTSAAVIQHPDRPDEPAYKVTVLAPAPAPAPRGSLPPTSKVGTPAPGTPASEPNTVERILSVSEISSIFLKSLLTSAEDFLGQKVEAAVITIPSWMPQAQRDAVELAAKNAGIPVIQLLEEAGAVASTTTHPTWTPEDEVKADRTQLVVDVGSSSTSLNLLSIRQGLSYVVASSTLPTGANAIDDRLIKHFATEFTKKNKVPLTVAPAPADSVQDQRAEAKLRLAIEHTKRTISASPGAATCSVESLKDGFDFTGSINRMRFDMVASPIYTEIANGVVDLLASAGVDAKEVDEIVYVGGTGSLPGLDERVQVSAGFGEDEVVTPFTRGIVQGGGIGDPTTILARGAAAQAALIVSLPAKGTTEDKELHDAILGAEAEQVRKVQATTRTLGVLFPISEEAAAENQQWKDLGGVFVPIVQKETALPTRRTIQLTVSLPESGEKRVALEIWEVKEGIRIEKIKSEAPADEDDEDYEEEEEEIKHRVISKEVLLGAVQLLPKVVDGAKTVVRVQVIVGIEGNVDVEVSEVVPEGKEGAVERVHVPGIEA
ncbi:actin-like ATPase domain-containing protein [Coprinellus micaceus]|uniref:Actin-like ATPase domain-containing protein n=1 Tax=Coprinellus micaceus TaxID=71717 RepID=A0A4Y7SL56_COPMI|nr:actin-like ATPase domain-containing protein [Coprinellus micaceus]